MDYYTHIMEATANNLTTIDPLAMFRNVTYNYNKVNWRGKKLMDRRPCMSQNVRYSLFGESTVEATNYKIIARKLLEPRESGTGSSRSSSSTVLVLVSQARPSFSFFFF